MNLYHAYHIYADGDWQRPWKEHKLALAHGLKESLSEFGVGIVGTPKNRIRVRQLVEEYGARVVAESDTGWEQLTLEWVASISRTHDGYVLYSHTKGSAFPSDVSVKWRRLMTYDAVVGWRDCVARLDEGFETVGTTWHEPSPEHGTRPYWAGNFWWATTAFIKELPPIGYAHRYDAEGWIGEHHQPIKQYAIHPGASSFLTAEQNDEWLKRR